MRALAWVALLLGLIAGMAAAASAVPQVTPADGAVILEVPAAVDGEPQ